MPTFSSRNEALDYIIVCIEGTGTVQDAEAEYDIEAIANMVVGNYPSYEIKDDPEAFWAAVEANAK